MKVIDDTRNTKRQKTAQRIADRVRSARRNSEADGYIQAEQIRRPIENRFQAEQIRRPIDDSTERRFNRRRIYKRRDR